jgi:hypothetical protein
MYLSELLDCVYRVARPAMTNMKAFTVVANAQKSGTHGGSV